MKILYCYRYGILGGVCTQIINRLRVFEESGQLESHLLFAQDHGISRTLEGYPHLVFERDPERVRKLAREGDYDAAVVIDTPEFLTALSGIEHLPLITEVHTTYDRGLQYLEDVDWSTVGFIVPSEYSQGLVDERLETGHHHPIRVVPNGLDPALFPIVKMQEVPRRPVFGWVGKLDAHKNWRGFLSIASLILERGGDADFWMIGGETAPLQAEKDLLGEISERGLDSRLRWLPRVEYRAMHRAYGAVRQSGGAMIVTSTDESFGMSVLEALLCQCPVVASRVGGIPEIAPESEGFQLYDFGQYGQAADAALSLLDPATAQRARTRLVRDHPRLEREFSSESVAERYVRTLGELVKPGVSRTTAGGRRTAKWAESPGAPVSEATWCAEVERLRPFVPGSDELDSVSLLRATARLLSGRSYRIARTVAARRGGPWFWISLPWQLWRIVKTEVRRRKAEG